MARGLVKDGFGKATPINRGIFERFTNGVNSQITSINPMDWMSPAQPIARVAPRGTQARIWDYRFGQNIDYTPKAFEGYCYDVLRDLAEGFDLLRMVIETRKDQVSRVPHSFTLRAKPGEPPGKQKERQMADKRIAQLDEFWKRPDGVHSFSDWQRAILEDMFVIDAPAIVPRWRRDGGIFGFDAIDGATISLLVDQTGRTPDAPDPAYRQIIKGMPAVDMMVPTAGLSKTDCLFYYPRNVRTSRLYGYSPVEQIVMTVNIGLRRQMHQLQWYTDGTIPDVFLEAPEGMSEERYTQFEALWNEKFASTQARRKANFIPFGTKVTFAKDPKLKDEMDEYLARKIAYAFSVSPTALVKMVNRAAGQQMSEDAKAEGLEPILFWFKEVMDDLLAFQGCADIEYSLGSSNRENPLLQAQIDQIYLSTVDDQGHSVKRANEVRDELGMDQIDYEAEDAKDFQTQLDQQGQRNELQNDSSEDAMRRQQQVQHADEPRPKAANCILCTSGMKAVGDGAKRHHVDHDGTKLLCYAGNGRKLLTTGTAIKKKQKITSVRIDTSQHSDRHQQAVERTSGLLQKFFKRQKSKLVAAFAKKKTAAVPDGWHLYDPKTGDEVNSKAIIDWIGSAQFRVAANALAMKDEDDDDDDVSDEIQDIIANILENFSELIDPISAELAATYLDQASGLMDALEMTESVQLSVLNKRALAFAKARAAEMVGKKFVDGELVDNPDAQWVITDTTRTALNALIPKAFEDGMTPADLTGAIDDLGIFSSWRSDLIASTEMANAQRNGARDTASDVGVIGKASQTSGDHTEDNCDGSCDEAEELGVIDIDDDYGVDGHFQGPNCNCVEVFYTADDPEAADLLGDRAAAAINAVNDALKYSPDQLRDDNGRWSAGTGDANKAVASYPSDSEKSFYVIRVQSKDSNSLAGKNAGDLLGVAQFLDSDHQESISNGDHLGLYKVTNDTAGKFTKYQSYISGMKPTGNGIGRMVNPFKWAGIDKNSSTWYSFGKTGYTASLVKVVPIPDHDAFRQTGAERVTGLHEALFGGAAKSALKYSPDQARDDDGRWTADGGATDSKDFKLDDGRKLTLSNDPDKKVAQVKEFAKSEMAKLPDDVQKGLNEGKLTSELFSQNGEYTPEREALHNQELLPRGADFHGKTNSFRD